MLISATIISYIFVSLPGYLLLSGNRKRTYCIKITSFFAGIGLRILDIHVFVKNNRGIHTDRNVLIISNHLSYLDALIISSKKPTIFITSEEVRKTFFLGLMAKLGGSIFVERRSILQLKEEIAEIAKILDAGFNVCFFPEATSSNGTMVLPFKTALLAAVKEGNRNFLPVCIKYILINGYVADRSNLDYVCYYGDMKFFWHFLKLLVVNFVTVELTVLEIIYSLDLSRKEAAEIAYKRISEQYKSTPMIDKI